MEILRGSIPTFKQLQKKKKNNQYNNEQFFLI